MSTSYFIFAGEASGDLHGSRLMHELRKVSLTSRFSGVGGPAMREEGLNVILKMEEFQVMGLTDVIKSFPKLWKHFHTVCNAIIKDNYECVILIDYPGFNLRLAKKLRQKGFKGKIVQYICPTVWAHGKGRIQTLAQTVDLLLSIFPFEPAYFSHTDLNVKYIGNPLTETIKNYPYQNEWYREVGLSDTYQLIAIFPGSRIGEIQRNLPVQIDACLQLKKKYPAAKFALSYAHEDLLEPIKKLMEKNSLYDESVFVPKKFSYELMLDCRMALAKSGTVTLELALHKCPSVIVYQLSQLNYLFAKYILRLRLPYYCIVNILADKQVFPELIGKNIDASKLFEYMEKLFTDENERKNIMRSCEEVQALLGNENASKNAAQAIVELTKGFV